MMINSRPLVLLFFEAVISFTSWKSSNFFFGVLRQTEILADCNTYSLLWNTLTSSSHQTLVEPCVSPLFPSTLHDLLSRTAIPLSSAKFSFFSDSTSWTGSFRLLMAGLFHLVCYSSTSFTLLWTNFHFFSFLIFWLNTYTLSIHIF